MKTERELTPYQKGIIKSTYAHELEDIESLDEVKKSLSAKERKNPTLTPLYAQIFSNPKQIRMPKVKTDEQLNIVSKGDVRNYILQTLQTALEENTGQTLSDDDKQQLLGQYRDNNALLRRGNLQRLTEANDSFTNQWRERVHNVQERFSGTIERVERFNRRFDKWNERTAEFRKKFDCTKREDDNIDERSR